METSSLLTKIHTTKKRLSLRIKQIGSVLLFGLPVAVWLTLRDKRTVYFLPHVGLGDYCIALGYLKAYTEKNKGQHVTLIVPPNRIEVSDFYPYWDDKLVLPRSFYLGIAYLGSVPGGMMLLQKFPRILSITYTLYSSKQLLEDHPEANVDDLVKLILDLPESVERIAPLVPDTDICRITQKYGLKRSRTVLLNPYTGGCAVREIVHAFYEKLTVLLQVKGYTVVTILGTEEQKPITGTVGIKTNLSEAWHLAQWCGWLIGTRSGFFDFLQPCGCNMIALGDGSYKQRDIFTLQASNGAIAREYVWNLETEQQLIDTIMADIDIGARVRQVPA